MTWKIHRILILWNAENTTARSLSVIHGIALNFYITYSEMSLRMHFWCIPLFAITRESFTPFYYFNLYEFEFLYELGKIIKNKDNYFSLKFANINRITQFKILKRININLLFLDWCKRFWCILWYVFNPT